MGSDTNPTFAAAGNLPFATVHGQFLHAAAANPHGIALVQGAAALTYTELLGRAMAFAATLTASGVSRGMLVAVDASRSMETVVALLGVLFAGGAYVPVQVCEAATASLLRRHGIRMLVANDKVAKNAGGGLAADLCVLSTEVKAAARRSTRFFDMPGEACGLTDAAYVLFTSGTTSARKGVIVPHRGIVRLVNDQKFLAVSSHDRVLLHSPLTFDASTLELWAPLLHGGTVVLAPERALSVGDLGTLVPAQRITTLWLTAGLFHLVAQQTIETFATLRHLLVGGDVIHAELFATVKQRFPQLHLVNGYGPTENTTFTTCYVAVDGFCESRVPIGEPINGTSVYILDQAGNSVAAGMPGELVTGGDGVALGYLDAPELTAKRFLPDPARAGSDARLYLTGDIVRRRADGQLDFLGRRDSEVKLAGQRVQLDDVEQVILRCDQVRACAAIAVDETAGKLLVAFIVWRDGEEEETLRASLRDALPGAAMPRVIRTVARLPLTENGKVDRVALLRQIREEGASGRTHPPPFAADDPWLQAVERIWCAILHRQTIEPNLNFFDCGGDSLGLVILQAELQKLSSAAPSIIELFSLPTVKSIADFMAVAAAPAEAKTIIKSSLLVIEDSFALAGRSS